MSVSEKEVFWCYRNLLGREPESDSAVKDHMPIETFRDLVQRFVDSQEFLAKRSASGSVEGAPREWLPMDLPRDRVDVSATPVQLGGIIAHIKKAWTQLGREKPHFSVLTNKEFLPENLNRSIDEFWGSGEVEARRILKMLERHEFGGTSEKTAVEYGCGLGRVTMGLAGMFAHVHGYDISAEHLGLAKKHAAEIGRRNVTFHECASNILEEVVPCDFYYSRIVFQHNPPPIIYNLIRNALRSLNPRGIAMFQVPVYSTGYQFDLEKWLTMDHKLDMQMHCLPQRHIFDLIAKENCIALEIREDSSTGSNLFLSNMFVVRKND